MSNNVKKKKEPIFNWWLFKTKGTAAEPWPTAEELWKDKNVQKELAEIKKVFKRLKK